MVNNKQPKIDKFPEEFLEYLSEQGVSNEEISKMRRMRGIIITRVEPMNLVHDTIHRNITIQYDRFEDEEKVQLEGSAGLQ